MKTLTSFEPKTTEEKWYKIWEEGGYFKADETDTKPPYSIVIPPPNVTGNLHMGHALNNTIQDILVRWQRMSGKSVLWMPGMDHAGIATQNVVEKLLRTKGITKNELGREKFEQQVWDWKAHSGGQIKDQLKRLGCSLDWPRERFTLDEGLSKAVQKVFISLYEEKLIYKGHKIINWCPRCETALSDIETEYEEKEGSLWHIKYKLVESDEFISVATTRPETMLGDTGVAVNPDDERYAHLVGKKVILPLVNREIPIFADSYVDKEFGTGMVKVTPAHDPNDYEMGKRNGLEEINVMDTKGIINENGGKYKDLDRFAAREKIVEDLKAGGYLLNIEKHTHSVGHCYRCQTVIEPYLSNQWFVKIKPLADEAIRVVENSSIKFVPKSWEKTYFEWMYNIRDWCISRQLWWGHRIPAYYCNNCDYMVVDTNMPKQCEKCQCENFKQDEDVLDTWFSSALWPFSTMDWPDDSLTLKKYYPTSVLVTGFDIIFFWVARMIMMGMKFMDAIPFNDVYIHALVRDEHGHKMSKSRGNVVDPLIIMDEYGTDAFRFTLAVFAAQGRDVVFSEKRVEGYRSFINKIWNATKFITMNLPDDFVEKEISNSNLEIFDKWILKRLNDTILKVTQSLSEYKFNDAANELYDFWWHEFCDWYIELTKQRLYSSDNPTSKETAYRVLFHILKTSLKLMHPFMPFITEEIWDAIKTNSNSLLIVSDWPKPNEKFNFSVEAGETEILKELVYKIRNIRGEMNVAPDKKISVIFKTSSAKLVDLINRESVHIKALSRTENISVDANYLPNKTDASAVMNDVEVFVPLEGLIDFEKERIRLEKELAKVKAEYDKTNSKLSNEGFTAKAPTEIIEKESKKRDELLEIINKLNEGLGKL